jgi:membrane-bound serine protease (ClpP class)
MKHTYSFLFLLGPALFLRACGTSGTEIPLYAIVIPALLVVLAAVGVVLLAVLRTNRRRASTGREGMIGEVGVVRRPVTGNSAGMVFVHGELWQALPEDPDGAPLETGSEVEVVGFRRSAVVVRPTERA